jgi:hypothetical protein
MPSHADDKNNLLKQLRDLRASGGVADKGNNTPKANQPIWPQQVDGRADP